MLHLQILACTHACCLSLSVLLCLHNQSGNVAIGRSESGEISADTGVQTHVNTHNTCAATVQALPVQTRARADSMFKKEHASARVGMSNCVTLMSLPGMMSSSAAANRTI